jgi:hypothetical protein
MQGKKQEILPLQRFRVEDDLRNDIQVDNFTSDKAQRGVRALPVIHATKVRLPKWFVNEINYKVE